MDLGQLQCDDGNTQSGDGCSSQCEVENGFACSGGLASVPDQCVDILPPVVTEVTMMDPQRVSLRFSEPVNFSTASTQSVVLSINGDQGVVYSFSWEFEALPSELSTQLFIALTLQSSLLGTETLLIEFPPASPLATDEAGNALSSLSAEVQLEPFIYETVLEKQASEQTGQSLGGLTFGTFVLNLVISHILDGSIEAMWNLLNLLQLVTLIPLMAVRFPPNVKRMFALFAFANADSGFLQGIVDNLFSGLSGHSQPFSETFEDYGFESTWLVHNSGSQLLLGAVLAGLYPFALALSVLEGACCKRCCCSCSFFRGFEQGYRFNMPFRAFILNFLELFLSVLLNLHFLSFAALPHILSSLVSLGLAVALLGLPFLFARILVSTARKPTSSSMRQYGTLFKALHVERPLVLMYYPFFLLRRAVFALVLVQLQDSPRSQCFICVGSSLAVMPFPFPSLTHSLF